MTNGTAPSSNRHVPSAERSCARNHHSASVLELAASITVYGNGGPAMDCGASNQLRITSCPRIGGTGEVCNGEASCDYDACFIPAIFSTAQQMSGAASTNYHQEVPL